MNNRSELTAMSSVARKMNAFEVLCPNGSGMSPAFPTHRNVHGGTTHKLSTYRNGFSLLGYMSRSSHNPNTPGAVVVDKRHIG